MNVNRFLVLLVALLFIIESCHKSELDSFEQLQSGIEVKRVYGDGINYCAFTSLLKYEGAYYLAFREAKNHVEDNDYGVIRIMKSNDGDNWRLWETVKQKDTDLRDPNLSKTPDGRMLLICGARKKIEGDKYQTTTLYAKGDRMGFNEAKEVELPDEFLSCLCRWVWRLTWHYDEGYGIIYGKNDEGYYLSLLKTSDGVHFRKVTDYDIKGEKTEAQIRFKEDGEAIVLVRRGSKENGYIGKSTEPYERWDWEELPIYLAGQDFIIDNNIIICSTRLTTNIGERTAIWYGDTEGSFQWCYLLPSSGKNSDTAYSSILKVDNSYWISYYSMHETAKPCIYLAKIPIGKLPYLK